MAYHGGLTNPPALRVDADTISTSCRNQPTLKTEQVYNEGDMVWVHGFHLLLLPSFLTRVLRTARVGLFLHTPFPSSEIFRTLPFREDLLRGMLNADQVCGGGGVGGMGRDKGV